jgi:hypothetical protein
MGKWGLTILQFQTINSFKQGYTSVNALHYPIDKSVFISFDLFKIIL